MALAAAGDPDWNEELKPGPLEIGFDSFFGTPKTHNEPPLVFVENHRVVGLDPADPICDRQFPVGPHGTMLGEPRRRRATGRKIDFIMADKAAAFLAAEQRTSRSFSILPSPRRMCRSILRPSFAAQASAGLYGDYIQQLDHCTGLVLDALEKTAMRMTPWSCSPATTAACTIAMHSMRAIAAMANCWVKRPTPGKGGIACR